MSMKNPMTSAVTGMALAHCILGKFLGVVCHCLPVPLSRNLGTLTSWNPLGHSRPVKGLIYLFINF